MNANGDSAPSLPSRPLAAARGQIKSPGAPVIVSAEIQDGRLSFSYHAPESDGGSPVLHYNISIDSEHRTIAMGGRAPVAADSRHSTYFVVDNVKDAQPQFSLSAVNDAGEGPAAHWPTGKAAEQPPKTPED